MSRTALKLLIAAAVFVGAAGFIALRLHAFNHFARVEERFSGACAPVRGVPGPEDVQIDRGAGRVFITSLDRRAAGRGDAVRGAVYAINLFDPLDASGWTDRTGGTPEAFEPLGAHLYEDGAVRRLFVVNAATDGVELFDVSPSGDLTHLETLAERRLTSPNDVVAVGPRAFYVSNDVKAGRDSVMGRVQFLARAGAGEVLYFDGVSWRVAASGLRFANGLATSADGARVYVAETAASSLRIYDRDARTGALSRARDIALPAAPDNISVDETGALWVGGLPKPLAVSAHKRNPQARGAVFGDARRGSRRRRRSLRGGSFHQRRRCALRVDERRAVPRQACHRRADGEQVSPLRSLKVASAAKASMTAYVSTRGRAETVEFDDALLNALAPDGGLYMPREWPRFDAAFIERCAAAPFYETAAAIVAAFAAPNHDVAALTPMFARAYEAFDDPAVAPLRRIGEEDWILELFHGPTLAFKDIAMQALGFLFDAVLTRRDRRATIIGATSGDTGAAAIEAFAGLERVDIVILHPEGRVSDVQRRLMTGVEAPNVFNLAIDGDFDDCQRIVKALFRNRSLADDLSLGGVNSINWARLAVQIVYYFTAAAALGAPARALSFSTPTGNFGDVFAGYAAKRMGLSIDRLCVAVNDNDILHRALTTGAYAPRAVTPTTSPSMDIQVASNFERLVFEASRRRRIADGRSSRSARPAKARRSTTRRFRRSVAISLPRRPASQKSRI